MKLYVSSKWILLLASCFISVRSMAQLSNASFENWHPDSNGTMRLSGWMHTDKVNGPGLLNGTYRETNSQHLNYALKLSRWYDYTWDKIIQKTPLATRPASVTGFYIYTDNELTGSSSKDTAYVFVALTKWNSILNRTDTVGQGTIELGPSAGFRFFEVPIIYSSPAEGDSLYIEISPSKFLDVPSYCANPGWCSYLTIDHLELKGIVSNFGDATLYPNPSPDKIYLGLPSNTKGDIRIINSSGQLVSKKKVASGNNELNVSALSCGLYFLILNEENGRLRTFRFVKN